jgi:hypothetical protein
MISKTYHLIAKRAVISYQPFQDSKFNAHRQAVNCLLFKETKVRLLLASDSLKNEYYIGRWASSRRIQIKMLKNFLNLSTKDGF